VIKQAAKAIVGGDRTHSTENSVAVLDIWDHRHSQQMHIMVK